MNKLRIGVSNCLIDDKESYIVDTLGSRFDLLPFDREYVNLKRENISGIIIKSKSLIPEVKPIFPLIPIEDIESISRPDIRDRFITSLFILNRWRLLKPLNDSIREFHESNKFLLISYSAKKYNELSYILFWMGRKSFWDLKSRYQKSLSELLERTRSRGGISRSLIKMFSIFKNRLNREDRYELQHMIKQYSRGEIPLLEPITMMNHYAKSLSVDSLLDQYFLHPDPIELNLLYHA